MYLPVPPQPDCASAWLAAARLVDAQPRHEAYNVVIDVERPTAATSRANPIVAEVEAFLQARNKSIACIANTIFPDALYRRHGSPEFADIFRTRVLPKVRRHARWSGYYFERMIAPGVESTHLGALGDIVRRMRDPANRARNKFELSMFDPNRDVDDSPYGGQCLSFLSFKILAGEPSRVVLTAQYRNHYYIEKLLGNLIGLGRLLNYVATEAGMEPGWLTVLSTHAEIDTPGARRPDIKSLFESCEAAISRRNVAA
jgi:hypothetical protein